AGYMIIARAIDVAGNVGFPVFTLLDVTQDGRPVAFMEQPDPFSSYTERTPVGVTVDATDDIQVMVAELIVGYQGITDGVPHCRNGVTQEDTDTTSPFAFTVTMPELAHCPKSLTPLGQCEVCLQARVLDSAGHEAFTAPEIVFSEHDDPPA